MTVGSKGSLVVTTDEVIAVPPVYVRHVVDTTGAGDLYASGFLYGLSQQRPMFECGQLGSIAISILDATYRPS